MARIPVSLSFSPFPVMLLSVTLIPRGPFPPSFPPSLVLLSGAGISRSLSPLTGWGARAPRCEKERMGGRKKEQRWKEFHLLSLSASSPPLPRKKGRNRWKSKKGFVFPAFFFFLLKSCPQDESRGKVGLDSFSSTFRLVVLRWGKREHLSGRKKGVPIHDQKGLLSFLHDFPESKSTSPLDPSPLNRSRGEAQRFDNAAHQLEHKKSFPLANFEWNEIC